MRPYGVGRNWAATEVLLKNGHAESARSHTVTKKIWRRIGRRAFKNFLRQNGYGATRTRCQPEHVELD